jgi:hypothetical protein
LPPGLDEPIDAPVDRVLKYRSWYPYFAAGLGYVSEKTCNASLKAYEGDAASRRQLGPVGSYCYEHSDCIMKNVAESIKANMAGATVVLGLIPTILASLGPTVGEMALLSWRRPVLSLLLSMGAPAIYPSRIMQSEDPTKLLLPTTDPLTSIMPRAGSRVAAGIVAVFEYVVPAAAIANLLLTSYELGTKTILSFDCGNSMMPLVWSLLPVAIHAFAVVGFFLSRRMYEENGLQTTPSSPISRSRTWTSRFFRSEVTSYVEVKLAKRKKRFVRPRMITLYFYNLAAFASILHLIMGTAVFSSLLYIGVVDAIRLLLRYAASALACRFIVCYELGGLQRSRRGYDSAGGARVEDIELARLPEEH